MKTLLFSLLVIAHFSCHSRQETNKEIITNPVEKDSHNKPKREEKKPITWTFDKIEGKVLKFKEGHSFETGLFELKYIGQIAVDEKAPFLIYSGRDCDKCDANISLYFHSPRNGRLDVENGRNRFAYPGKVYHYETNELIEESNAYFGEVLKGKLGIMWFNRIKDGDLLVRNTTFAKIDGNEIHNLSLNDQQSSGHETLSLNKAGKNKLIQPVEFTSEP